jgi:hypothetical protein
MAIMVHFKDNTVCFVPDNDLVDLIISDRIIAFRRGMEWVNLSVESIQNRDVKVRKSAGGSKGVAARGDVWKRVMISDLR